MPSFCVMKGLKAHMQNVMQQGELQPPDITDVQSA